VNHPRRLLAAMLVSAATMACSAQASPTGSLPSSAAPSGTPWPTANPLAPDPNAPNIRPRDPWAPARAANQTHEIYLVLDERHNLVAPGLVREVWAYGGAAPGTGMVPGPVIRVQVGDTIRIHLDNHPPILPGLVALMHPPVNSHSHSMELPAQAGVANGDMSPLQPGQTGVYEFTAEHAGVWLYHCTVEPTLEHLANGEYGMLIVEPRGGLQPVDQEFFLVRGEWYLGGPRQSASLPKVTAPNAAPDFVAFNGIADQYWDHPIAVETGARIRVFIVDAGPIYGSSFHVQGAAFDRVVMDGTDLGSGEGEGWRSPAVRLAPGQGAIVEFTLAEDGAYPFGAYGLHVSGLGARGIFRAGTSEPIG
jgi:nitrite reductase (NO-forming)